MGEDHIRASFYEADSIVGLSELDHTLFTHLIFVPSLPLKFLRANVQLRGDDVHHASTFAHAIPPSSKALLALSYRPDQPALLASSIEMAREHHFHGVHFTLNVVHVDFLQFCASWREAAVRESRQTCRRPLLLTASFYAWSPSLTVPAGVGLPLDWICLRGYHQGVSIIESRNRFFSDVGSLLTFAHTALHGNASATCSIESALRTCLDAGIDPSVLVLGLAMHGFSFQLQDPSLHGMHAPCRTNRHRPKPATVARHKLPHLSKFGSVTYRHIVKFIGDHSAKICHDGTTQSAYCYVGTTWIGYDDTYTITQKVDYIKSLKLKGYALDSLHEDTSNWDLSNAARSSLLGDNENKQTINFGKGKEIKGKQKVQSRARKEIIDFGVHLSTR